MESVGTLQRFVNSLHQFNLHGSALFMSYKFNPFEVSGFLVWMNGYVLVEFILFLGLSWILKKCCFYWNAFQDSWKTTLLLAYQSLGVVYGDLSISPLYVYKSTFAEDIEHSDTNEEIYGVLSFVFWTLTLVPLFKYVFVVLRADDNGEGK